MATKTTKPATTMKVAKPKTKAAPKKPAPCCGNCVFMNTTALGSNPNTGLCRRYPQSVNKRIEDWCGEHKYAT